MNNISVLLSRHKQGWSLEQEFYTSPEVLRVEADLIWKRNWLFAGFTCEIPKPGDYFTYKVFQQSAIIIRGDNGNIYAHHNTCRHRGSIICQEERGNERNLKCPYHHWIYEKNGNLRNARLMPENFIKENFGLHPIQIQLIEGIIFISFSEYPPAFLKETTDLGPYLAPYNLNHAKVAFRERYEINANWKLIGENFRECYHCGPVHIEYCRAVIGANLVEQRKGILEEHIPLWIENGLAVETIEQVKGSCHYATRYPLRPGYQSYSLDGKPVAPPMGTHKTYNNGVVGLITYPNFWMDAVTDYIWVMRITPIDATHSVVDLTWLVDGKTEEGKDYDIERLTEFWKITGEQDWHLCENNQRGILSDKYEPGPMSSYEIDVVNFHQWYLNILEAGSTKKERWKLTT